MSTIPILLENCSHARCPHANLKVESEIQLATGHQVEKSSSYKQLNPTRKLGILRNEPDLKRKNCYTI